MCTHVCVCAYVYTCMYTCVYVCMCMHVCVHVCVYMHVYVCVCAPFDVKIPTWKEELKVQTSMQQFDSHEWLMNRPIVPVRTQHVRKNG